MPLLEDGQLLAQGEVLDHQFQPGPEQYPGNSNRQYPSEANHATSIADGWPTGKANAFPTGPKDPQNQSLRNNVEALTGVSLKKQNSYQSVEPENRCMNRRHFLGQTLLAGSAVALPLLIPARALGRDGAVAPSERIVLGGIGL